MISDNGMTDSPKESDHGNEHYASEETTTQDTAEASDKTTAQDTAGTSDKTTAQDTASKVKER